MERSKSSIAVIHASTIPSKFEAENRVSSAAATARISGRGKRVALGKV